MALARYPGSDHNRRSAPRRGYIAGPARPPPGLRYEELPGAIAPLRGRELARRPARYAVEMDVASTTRESMLRGPQPQGPLVRRGYYSPGHGRAPNLVDAVGPVRPQHQYDTRAYPHPPSPYLNGCLHHCNSSPQCYHQKEPEPKHFEHCSCSQPSSSKNPNSNGRKEFDFKTKDVVVRGKGFAVRSSYLVENMKFEDGLCKYMEKKSEEEVPDKCVEMVISFINRETYKNSCLTNEVIVNVIASNAGAKSAQEYSLDRLKKWDLERLGQKEVGELIALVMCSGKVEDGLRQWLVGFLGKQDSMGLNRYERFVNTWEGQRLEYLHPNAMNAVEDMLGWRQKGVVEKYRIL